ncbi:MAG TPA: GreA/GreB family elongation factor [Kofleriaceae bacterium]|nr:GreA/GreB family elongation factor [Kofleriaceae bacterium]
MDKQFLVDQLITELRASVRAALSASEVAGAEVTEGATPAEKREDARAALEFGALAGAHNRRARRVQGEIDALTGFRPPPWRPGAAVGTGAVVEVEDADSRQGRTFFLAPAGAGITLTGPDGDGFLSVVTAASPIGRAVLGRRLGDIVDVTVEGEAREWTITWIG